MQIPAELMVFLPWIVLFGLIAALHVIGRRFARNPRVTDTACGSCRYLLSGISSEACPECGRSLRDVGVLLPAMPGTPKYPLAAWIRVGWVAIIMGLIVPPVWTAVFVMNVVETTVIRKHIRLNSPQSRAYNRIELSASTTGDPDAARFDEVELFFRFQAGNSGMERLALVQPLSDTDAPVMAFDPAELRAVFVRAGLDPDDRAIALEMEALQRFSAFNFILDPSRTLIIPPETWVMPVPAVFDPEEVRAAMLHAGLDPDDPDVVADLQAHQQYAVASCPQYLVDAYVKSVDIREALSRSRAAPISPGGLQVRFELQPFQLFGGGGGGRSEATGPPIIQGTFVRAWVASGITAAVILLLSIVVLYRSQRYWLAARRRAAEEHLRRVRAAGSTT